MSHKNQINESQSAHAYCVHRMHSTVLRYKVKERKVKEKEKSWFKQSLSSTRPAIN